jgi:hypothetical protein
MTSNAPTFLTCSCPRAKENLCSSRPIFGIFYLLKLQQTSTVYDNTYLSINKSTFVIMTPSHVSILTFLTAALPLVPFPLHLYKSEECLFVSPPLHHHQTA